MPVAAVKMLMLRLFCWYLMMQIINGHPQCLDFRPPFQNSERLFCSQYAEFGCCNVTHDQLLRVKYNRILDTFKNDVSIDQRQCPEFLKNILCQECSPYAAHVYDAEAEQIKRPFAGLCNNYCGDFFDKCSKLIPHITDDAGITQVMKLKDQFCNLITLPDLDYCFPDWVQIHSLNQSLSRETITEEGCLCLEPFAKDEMLRNALSFRYSPDGSGRIFISEQIGVIHIFYKNQTKIPEPFMNLTDIVLVSSSNGDERGFLNVAFHPRFGENGKFYVYFSISNNERRQQQIRISEFHVSDLDKNKVNRSSERIVLEVDQPYWNHNGGELLFGVDGYLYAFLGDGGAGGDPHGNGQNKGTLLGSVIRLDVDHFNNRRPYSIPVDNPFINDPGSRPEIYAYGIRNIWRCDLDEGNPDTGYGKGRIFCGDVGQNKYEEIDLIKKGRNYGWNSREGFECYKQETCGKIGPEELPIYAYSHDVGNSVTGGHMYRGCMNPNLQGLYIYGDYANGKLFRLKETIDSTTGQSSWKNKEINMCNNDVCFNGLVNRYQRNILSFGEDDDGEIYILSTDFASSTNFGSKIYKLVDPRRRGDPTKCRTYVKNSDPDGTTNTDTGMPQSPIITDVMLNARDRNAIDMSWSSGVNDKDILHYVIQYRSVPSGVNLRTEQGWIYLNNNIPSTTNTFTISNLKSSTSYQLRIAAANSFGQGPFSVSSPVVELSSNFPSGSPRNLVANGHSTSAIVLRWEPPLEEYWNRTLSGYIVRYKASSDPISAMQYKRINTHQITAEIITGLELWTKYEVSVAAFSDKGMGAYSEITHVWTLEGIPTSPPQNVNSRALHSTIIELSWFPADAGSIHGRIKGYKIRARFSNNTRIVVEKTVPADMSNLLGRQVVYLTGLRKHTEYDIVISCYTSQGEGPPSVSLRQMTLQDVPERVRSLKFDNIQSSSVLVMWTPPANSNGILTGYTLAYQLINIPQTQIIMELSPMTLSYTLIGLRSDVVYSVDLYASTIAGHGPIRTARLEIGPVKPDAIEICQLGLPLDARTLRCGPGLLITKISAKYGRMNLGKCIRDNYGSIGCSKNVTSTIDQWCAGRKQCTLHDWFLQNRIILPDRDSSCPDHLEKYLDITYECGDDPCGSSPCQNNGTCDASEDPYKIGYYCFCESNFGGRHCQIADPCTTHTCPEKITHLCLPVMFDDTTGRVCYDKGWRFIDVDTPDAA